MQNRELHYLTVLRAFAAIWVGLHHCATTLKLSDNSIFLSPFFARGWLGVDLFFILSGFILSYSYREKIILKDFWVKRFARVYPAHIFVLGLYLVLINGTIYLGLYHDSQNRFTWEELLAQVFLIHGIGIFEPKAWNIPSWSISSEILAYILFPLMLSPLKRVKGINPNFLIILLLLGTTVTLAAVLNDGKKFMLDFEFTWVRILSEFAMGMVLFRFTSYFKPRKEYSLLALLAGVCIYGQTAVSNHFYDFIYLLYFMILIHALALLPNSKRVPYLSTLGETSYAFYLVHSIVLIGLNQLSGRIGLLIQYPLFNIFLFFVLSQLAAWGIYQWVEKPGRNFLRSLFSGPNSLSSRDLRPGPLQDHQKLGF